MDTIANLNPSPPGWYPYTPTVLRWWDGNAWTEHTSPILHSAPGLESKPISYERDRVEVSNAGDDVVQSSMLENSELGELLTVSGLVNSDGVRKVRFLSFFTLFAFLPVLVILFTVWVVLGIMIGETPILRGSAVSIFRDLSAWLMPLLFLWMFAISLYAAFKIWKKEIGGTSFVVVTILNALFAVLGIVPAIFMAFI